MESYAESLRRLANKLDENFLRNRKYVVLELMTINGALAREEISLGRPPEGE